VVPFAFKGGGSGHFGWKEGWPALF
jgi:hypothetical protein